jgi:hypothetical protein
VVATVGVLVLGLCLARGGRATAIGVSALAFPVLYAISPETWQWNDGRYAIFLPPLLALVAVNGCEHAVTQWERLRCRPRAVATMLGDPGDPTLAAGLENEYARDRYEKPQKSVRSAPSTPPTRTTLAVSKRSGPAATVVGMLGAALVLALSVAGFHQATGISLHTYARGWSDPDRASERTVAALEAAHIGPGYADYWVAYKLDFLSGGKLELGTSGTDVVAFPSIQIQAAEARHQSWVFVPPADMAVDEGQFGDTDYISGPDGVTLAAFVSGLQRTTVPFRLLRIGLIDVIITSEPIDASTVGVGLPGPVPVSPNARPPDVTAPTAP